MVPESLVAGLLRGDRANLARAITLIESNAPAHRPAAREVLRLIGTQPAEARRIGISGPPGAGKSTFIEALGNHLCDLGHQVAVLAVDPSSSLSGGSILGDKTRMETLACRPQCFIRPSPSGGALGGVARKTRETVALCEAAGFDIILIETVGVGQSEIAVRALVDCLILLLLAGAGDELQGIKKGILEIADLFVINKADGSNKQRALLTRAELARIVPLLQPTLPGWQPPVLAISSLGPEGPAEVQEKVDHFFDHLNTSGQLDIRRREQTLSWWRDLVAHEVHLRFLAQPRVTEQARLLEDRILSGEIPPSVAAEELLRQFAPASPA